MMIGPRFHHALPSLGASLFPVLVAVPRSTTEGLAASAGGSELPWWTPIAVSLFLVLISVIYRLRHRPVAPPPGNEGEERACLPENGPEDSLSGFHLRHCLTRFRQEERPSEA